MTQQTILYNGKFSNTLIYENKRLPSISKKYLRKWEGPDIRSRVRVTTLRKFIFENGSKFSKFS